MPKKRTIHGKGYSKRLQRVYANLMRSLPMPPAAELQPKHDPMIGFTQSDTDRLIAADQKRQRRGERMKREMGVYIPPSQQ